MNRRMKFSVATVVGVSGAVLGPGVQAVGIGFPPADQAPTAIIRVPQYLGVAPLAVVLDGSASSDAEGAIVSYEWRVDGRRLDGASVRWRFEELGEYDVVLTVRDDSGQAASAEAVGTVAGGPWTPRSEVTEPEARRFLWQAAWGAHPDDVDFVMEHGFEAWIEAQEQTPATYYDDASMDELADLLRDETIEEVSEGPRDGVRATGVTRTQETFTSVLSQAMPSLVGNSLYLLDISIRSSTILGIVGAGGIGFVLITASRLLAWDTLGGLLAITFVIVYAIELTAGWVRKQLI